LIFTTKLQQNRGAVIKSIHFSASLVKEGKEEENQCNYWSIAFARNPNWFQKQKDAVVGGL
jgi:hypothetical protein